MDVALPTELTIDFSRSHPTRPGTNLGPISVNSRCLRGGNRRSKSDRCVLSNEL